MRLVDDQRVVAAQLPVPGQFGQQDAVGHQLDQRVVGRHVGEAHLIADRLAERAAQFLGDPLGHRPRGQPPRLGVPDLPADTAAQLEADLGDLGGLARAGLPRDDHHLVVADGRHDLVLALADRQLGRIRDRRHGFPACGPGGGVRRGPRLLAGVAATAGLVCMRPGAPPARGAPRPGAPGWRPGLRGWRLGARGSRLGGRGELSGRRHHGSRLHTGGKNKSDWPPLHNTFRPSRLPPRPWAQPGLVG